MISIVCVYNNEEMLRDVLLKSLKNQTVAHELIALDNRDRRFKSAAEALNHGGAQARGDYIMFAHQDMWLGSDSYLEEAEKVLATIPDLGIAGVAGQTEKGGSWGERARWSIDQFGVEWEGLAPVDCPEVVQTLDECLLIVPRLAFQQLKFDDEVFDGWDCYGADYCLSVRKVGLRAYVIPGSCSHSCLRARYKLWELKGLLKYQRKLYQKHRRDHGCIRTWTGDVTRRRLLGRWLSRFIGPAYLTLFPNMRMTLERELSGCETVLDLGCGPFSPIFRHPVSFSVGVELYDPYLQETKRKRIHTDYIKADLRHIAFKPKSFDAVVAIDVLEHLTQQEGRVLLDNMALWARKKVLVVTPNGYLAQEEYDQNPLQDHKSGWNVRDLKNAGFKVRGINGWKRLRGEKALIKYRPVPLWSRISEVSQRTTYWLPQQAFQLLAVKRTEGSHGK